MLIQEIAYFLTMENHTPLIIVVVVSVEEKEPAASS
jgi:hypothetical protein